MRTIGLIGGMSWESTVHYYEIINEYVKKALGGLHSAQILLYSVDFAPIEELQSAGDWDKSAEILGDAAARLEQAGAGCIVICTNTMHKVAPQIQQRVKIPLLHIAEATAARLEDQCIDTVALLGTKYTMTQDFYKARLEQAGVRVLVPETGEEIEEVNDVIFRELCLGVVRDESRVKFQKIINRLAARGAQGVILGCTEIGMLLGQEDVPIPVFDTTVIHAETAARWSLE